MDKINGFKFGCSRNIQIIFSFLEQAPYSGNATSTSEAEEKKIQKTLESESCYPSLKNVVSKWYIVKFTSLKNITIINGIYSSCRNDIFALSFERGHVHQVRACLLRNSDLISDKTSLFDHLLTLLTTFS